MTERWLRVGAAALALVGAAISAYLLYVRHGGGLPVCSSSGCETVQRSSYSELVGIPVAAFGLAGYLTLVGAAIARGDLARTAQAVVALSALGFSIYLLYVQLHLIGAVCEWCLASDLVITGLAALALLRLRVATDGVLAPAGR